MTVISFHETNVIKCFIVLRFFYSIECYKFELILNAISLHEAREQSIRSKRKVSKTALNRNESELERE